MWVQVAYWGQGSGCFLCGQLRCDCEFQPPTQESWQVDMGTRREFASATFSVLDANHDGDSSPLSCVTAIVTAAVTAAVGAAAVVAVIVAIVTACMTGCMGCVWLYIFRCNCMRDCCCACITAVVTACMTAFVTACMTAIAVGIPAIAILCDGCCDACHVRLHLSLPLALSCWPLRLLRLSLAELVQCRSSCLCCSAITSLFTSGFCRCTHP